MPCRTPHRERGLTLVDLLVGLAVGLLVLAGASLQALRQLDDGRRLLAEAQVQQELRAAADVIVRDLRRAGHWGAAVQGLRGTQGQSGQANPFAALEQSSGETHYAYARGGADDAVLDEADRAGLRLRHGVLEMRIGGAGWQALTDPRSITITQLAITPHVTTQALSCIRDCGPADAECPPQLLQRELQLALAGRAVHDADVQRGLATRVRLRNPIVTGRCPA